MLLIQIQYLVNSLLVIAYYLLIKGVIKSIKTVEQSNEIQIKSDFFVYHFSHMKCNTKCFTSVKNNNKPYIHTYMHTHKYTV